MEISKDKLEGLLDAVTRLTNDSILKDAPGTRNDLLSRVNWIREEIEEREIIRAGQVMSSLLVQLRHTDYKLGQEMHTRISKALVEWDGALYATKQK